MKLKLLAVLGLLAVFGCGPEITPPVDGPSDIAFELFFPGAPSSSRYVGVSGIAMRTIESYNDTAIVRVPTSAFYGQFFGVPPTPTPANVELNGFELEQHLTTDTLRFGSAPNNSFFGLHTWQVTDSGAAPAVYRVDPVQVIDTIVPLADYLPIRPDTALVLSWRRSATAGDNILITWIAPGVETYSRVISDGGRITIPATDVARFAGNSELILSRFRVDSHVYRGRVLSLIRVAQRSYNVAVEG